MKRLAKILIAGSTLAAATLAISPACADSSTNASGSQILNGQVNFQSTISTLNTAVNDVGGDVGVQSTAAANVVDITTMNDTVVNTSQYSNGAQSTSTLNAQIANIGGNVGVVNQALCNSASVSTDPAVTAVTNYQECAAKDPTATAKVDVSGVNGSFSLANSAISNNFEADTNAASMPIANKQINNAAAVSSTTANVAHVAGTVSVSSAAIGNNAQVVHYSTDN